MLGNLQRMVQALLAAGFVAGVLEAAGLLCSETIARQDTSAALRRALWIENQLARSPNVDDEERLAEIDPSHAEGAFRESVRIDPSRSAAWLALGLHAEANDEWGEAEQDLLEAARVDHQYIPAWTLANFYLRRENPDAFWEWARLAARRTYDEFAPLLRLVDHFDQDPLRVLARLGDDTRLERGYLSYLIAHKRLGEAQRVALRLATGHDPSDSPRFADLASRQLAAGNPSAALEAWNLSHAPPLNPVRGPVLTNTDFRSSPSGEGFDWTLGSGILCPGGLSLWSPGQMRFTFSGGQPDDCILLTQTLILAPGRRYRLNYERRAEGRPEPCIVTWELGPPEGRDVLRSSHQGSEPSTPHFSPNWVAFQFIFPKTNEALARLRLLYHRPPGTTRCTGSVWLRHLNLEVL